MSKLKDFFNEKFGGTQVENKTKPQKMKTRELLCKTLEKLNCEYKIEEDENKAIVFKYQNEWFKVEADDDFLFITIWDLWWGEWEANDIDNFSRLKRVINDANIRGGVIVVYSINDEQKVGIHSKMQILFCQDIDKIDEYLSAILSRFFYVHQFVSKEMARLQVEEDKAN